MLVAKTSELMLSRPFKAMQSLSPVSTTGVAELNVYLLQYRGRSIRCRYRSVRAF